MVRPSTRPLSSARQQKTDGYIVIIVLLLTAVLLTLGLSLATRTTEEVYQSGQEADTTRVFNAAETGIEAALYKLQSDATFTIDNNNPDITNKVFTNQAGSNQINADTEADLTVTGQTASDFTIDVKQGEALTLAWKDATKISWTHLANCTNAAAIIVTLYNKTSATTVESLHVAYDPNGAVAGCTKGSNFTEAGAGSSGGSTVTLSKSTFSLAVEPLPDSILRIRPVYADASFKVENSSATRIVSTASDTSGGGTSAETRKIEVIRTEPAAPAVFDYAVFSGGSLTKN